MLDFCCLVFVIFRRTPGNALAHHMLYPGKPMSHIRLSMVTKGGDLQTRILADRMLTGLGEILR
jgi:hypothetical protein